jgi:hypothetical protein
MTGFSNLPVTSPQQALSLVVPSPRWEGDERCELARRRFAILQFDRVGCDERRRARNSVDFLRNEANG